MLKLLHEITLYYLQFVVDKGKAGTSTGPARGSGGSDVGVAAKE